MYKYIHMYKIYVYIRIYVYICAYICTHVYKHMCIYIYSDACSLGCLPDLTQSFLLIIDEGIEYFVSYPTKTRASLLSLIKQFVTITSWNKPWQQDPKTLRLTTSFSPWGENKQTNLKGEALLCDPQGILANCLYFPLNLISILNNVRRCRRSAVPEAVMPKVD